MLEFRVLGPLEVLEQGVVVTLGRGKERSLLALLLLHANEVVSIDRLVDDLWTVEPPAQAAKTVQVYVSRLRRRLGDDVLLTRSPGYVLVVAPEQLDLARFEHLVAAARDQPPAEATLLLGEALSLFRGPVLTDVGFEPFAQAEIARLEELRLAALEARIEADLALGRHSELVPELDVLVRNHPLRERFRAQLALALYRSGRQVEALDRVREGRRALVEELGLEPAEELKELERSILSHDPALDAPPQAPPLVASPLDPGRRGRSRRSLVLGAAALGAAVVVAAALAVTRLDADEAPLVAPHNSVAVIDPDSNVVTATIRLTDRPGRIRVDGDDVWVLQPDARALTRLNRAERVVERTTGLGGSPEGLVVHDGRVWLSNSLAGTLTVVDAARLDEMRTFGVRTTPLRMEHTDAGPLAVGFGSLWFASGQRTVSRVDPSKVVVRAAITDVGTGEPGEAGIVVGRDAVWVADLHAVTRIDPRSNTIVTVLPLPVYRPGGMVVSPEGLWISDVGSDQVFLVDTARNRVAGATKVGGQPLSVAYGAGAVWVANSGDGTVTRIDPTTGEVVDTIAVGGSPTDIAATDGEIWVTVA